MVDPHPRDRRPRRRRAPARRAARARADEEFHFHVDMEADKLVAQGLPAGPRRAAGQRALFGNMEAPPRGDGRPVRPPLAPRPVGRPPLRLAHAAPRPRPRPRRHAHPRLRRRPERHRLRLRRRHSPAPRPRRARRAARRALHRRPRPGAPASSATRTTSTSATGAASTPVLAAFSAACRSTSRCGAGRPAGATWCGARWSRRTTSRCSACRPAVRPLLHRRRLDFLGASAVAVLSHESWRRRFGGDPRDRRKRGAPQRRRVHRRWRGPRGSAGFAVRLLAGVWVPLGMHAVLMPGSTDGAWAAAAATARFRPHADGCG